MTKITKFDRPTCKLVRDEVLEALKAVEAKLGVKIDYGSGNFDDTTFNMKLKLTAGGEQGAQDAERAEFNRYCIFYDLEPQDYGVIFQDFRGRKFKLLGFLPKGRDNVFLVEDIITKRKFRMSRSYANVIRQARKKAA
jgi:hypothetical protein